MGYNKSSEGQTWAFASYQDDVQMVRDGDVVGSRYKILKITPLAVMVEDATSHQVTELAVPK
jgi:hypothetical protein